MIYIVRDSNWEIIQLQDGHKEHKEHKGLFSEATGYHDWMKTTIGSETQVLSSLLKYYPFSKV